VQVSRGADYTLPDNIENIVVGTYAGSDLTSATLTGNALANKMIGHSNDETMLGLGGNDALYGKNGNDTLNGGDGHDLLDGGGGNDTLIGGVGNDRLIGRTGDDTMTGGTGNDAYYVDSAGDVVTETASEGTDTVYESLATYTLGANVENGRIQLNTGAGLYGNELDNLLVGGGGNDTLYGLDGNDTFHGNGGDDLVGGFDGNDTLYGEAGIDTLYGDNGDDTLYGGDGNDTLYGYFGNDTLNGGNGDDWLLGHHDADTVTGGAGNDTFAYWDASDSTPGAFDQITDFNSAGGEGADDQIDLSTIDADTATAGNQAFTFGFAPAAHTIWYSALANPAGGSDWVLYGDVNGDTTADFELHFHLIGTTLFVEDITL
jgi:Ca2+-binding RTX toxin-like protein